MRDPGDRTLQAKRIQLSEFCVVLRTPTSAQDFRRSESGTDADQSFLAAADELIEATRQGATVDLGNYLDRFPDRAQELRDRYSAARLFASLSSSTAGSDGSDPSDPNRPDSTRTRFGDFRILREIGRGGMGIVYDAEQVSAFALHGKGDLDDAIASYRRALQLRPDWSDTRYNFGNALLEKGQSMRQSLNSATSYVRNPGMRRHTAISGNC